MFRKIAIAASLVIASSAAMAADAPKFYAGADIGITKADGDSHRETGEGAFAGYQFCEHIAIEAGYRRLESEDGVTQGVSYNGHTDQLAVSAVGTLPLSNGFSVFGRLGVNRLMLNGHVGNESLKDHANRGVYGVGVGYSFTPTVSARLELQRPINDLTNLSAGVVFKF